MEGHGQEEHQSTTLSFPNSELKPLWDPFQTKSARTGNYLVVAKDSIRHHHETVHFVENSRHEENYSSLKGRCWSCKQLWAARFISVLNGTINIPASRKALVGSSR